MPCLLAHEEHARLEDCNAVLRKCMLDPHKGIGIEMHTLQRFSCSL